MIFIMAWRNIWRNKIRSLLIIFSVVTGLFAGIAILALYKGMMKSRVRTVIYAEVGHIQVHDSSFTRDYEPVFFLSAGGDMLKAIRSMPEVKLAAPRSITNGMLSTATGSSGVKINGVIPELEYEASRLKEKIKAGPGFDSLKKNEVLVGRKLADKMKLKPGSKLVLTFTDTALSIVSGAFRVAAIYQSDNAPLDERNVYVTMSDLDGLLGIGNAFHEIVILLKEDAALSAVASKLRKNYPAYAIETWKQISPETDFMVKTTDQFSYIIMVIIMFALAFGIINTMLMAILERTREIGMMVALGTNKLMIFLLVLLETVMLTLTGMPVGILVAWLVIAYYNRYGLDLSGMGNEMMSSFGFETMTYPEFPADKLTGVMLIVGGTAMISALFPAVKALKLRPVEALAR